MTGPAFARIPDEMKAYPHWVVWRYERRAGQDKPTKVPHSPRTRKLASVSDPSTWGSFDEAASAVQPLMPGAAAWFNGIGFVFSDDNPYAGIDLDGFDDPRIQAVHQRIFDTFDSYSEWSPSGREQHIIVKGKLPNGRRRDFVEAYSSARFFTMTGHVCRDAPITERQAQLDALWIELGGAVTAPAHTNIVSQPIIASDDELMARMMGVAGGDVFRALWHGDGSVLEGADRSGSAIDLALVDRIQFHTKNVEQIERIWLRSPHGQRTKTRSRADYRRSTIQRAFEAPLPPVDIGMVPPPHYAAVPAFGGAPMFVKEPPRPLRREMPAPLPFPIEALGDVLGGAARAIVGKIVCPPAIAAMSVLGAASLAVQAHADVVHPSTGHLRPTSLFLLTIAASGERKSAADTEAQKAIGQFEKEQRATYEAEYGLYANWTEALKSTREAVNRDKKLSVEAKTNALNALGSPPKPPLRPILTCPEPTFEGLCRLYIDGFPMLGIFSDEGGQFLGGHGLSKDHRLATIAGLSAAWDGTPIKRVRVTDGVTILPGRRLAMHLMAQPEAASMLLADPMAKDQGFLSRLLVAAPASTAGTRFQHRAWHAAAYLDRYHQTLLAILQTRPPLAPGSHNELEPRSLPLDEHAAEEWRRFADDVEQRLASDGPFEPIRGFANKLPEQALRLAGVLALIDNLHAPSIDTTTLRRAIALAEFFASEALRLFDAGATSPDIRLAESLFHWLRTKWNEDHIGLKVIYQRGPNAIRDKATAQKAVAILEGHGWLEAVSGPDIRVNGAPVKEAWRIVREWPGSPATSATSLPHAAE